MSGIFDPNVLNEAIIARLAPIQSMGVRVQFLADTRTVLGFDVDESVIFAWAAIAPVQVGANRSAGRQTLAYTLQGRGHLASLYGDGVYGVEAEIRRLLTGQQFTDEGRGSYYLEYSGFQFLEPQQGDPSYRFDVRYQMIVQSSVR